MSETQAEPKWWLYVYTDMKQQRYGPWEQKPTVSSTEHYARVASPRSGDDYEHFVHFQPSLLGFELKRNPA